MFTLFLATATLLCMLNRGTPLEAVLIKDGTFLTKDKPGRIHVKLHEKKSRHTVSCPLSNPSFRFRQTERDLNCRKVLMGVTVLTMCSEHHDFIERVASSLTPLCYATVSPNHI